MTYEVYLDPQVVRFLKKVEKQLAKRIRKRLKALEQNPFLYISSLEGSDLFKLRIGNYRAIIDIEKTDVMVRYVAHRSKVYKRFR